MHTEEEERKRREFLLIKRNFGWLDAAAPLSRLIGSAAGGS
jgi:hypothetical protein